MEWGNVGKNDNPTLPPGAECEEFYYLQLPPPSGRYEENGDCHFPLHPHKVGGRGDSGATHFSATILASQSSNN